MNNPLVYIDQDGELADWIVYTIIGLFFYVKTVYENTPKADQGNLSKWNWLPWNWNKPDQVVFHFGSNTDGSGMYGGISAGKSGQPQPMIGYNKDMGPGIGYHHNGNSNMYHPKYDYNKPEKAAVAAIKEGLSRSQFYTTTQGARYFSSKRGAYNYMWDNTNNAKGDPWREVSGWELENGDVIVLPFNKNDKYSSYNDALTVKSDGSKMYGYVIFNGKTYKIATHVHTHPGTGPSNNPLQISTSDLRMIQKVQGPIHIIQNKTVYSVDGSYNYQTGMYNYKKINFIW